MNSKFKFSLIFTLLLACGNVWAVETSTTSVDPVTQESTTTTVNPATDEKTITTVNPVTQESSSTTSTPTKTETTVTKTNPQTGATTTIITSVPTPQEAVDTPAGYSNCFTVAAGWNNDRWVAEHRVCQYDPSKGTYQGTAWIQGHWACSEYIATTGVCTKWIWNSSRWVNSCEVY